jgi:pullulanase/glycogen debranching enzyme
MLPPQNTTNKNKQHYCQDKKINWLTWNLISKKSTHSIPNTITSLTTPSTITPTLSSTEKLHVMNT